jgi:hypothetical protein
MRQTSGPSGRSRRLAVVMSLALVTAPVLASLGAASAGAAAPAPSTTRVGGMAVTAGGFGLPSGSLDTSVGALAPTADGFGSAGGCAGYANHVGAGIYCSSGSGGGPYEEPPTLKEDFPGVRFNPCKVDTVPAGMKAPHNKTPSQGQWYLQACMSGINWDTYDGGPEKKVTLSFVYISNDEPDPTQENLSDPEKALSDRLWDSIRSNYPVPFVTAKPTHIPRVNVPTWFQFRWMNSDNEVSRKPHSTNPNGDPWLELHAGEVTLRAESVDVRVDPQVEGVDTAHCGAVPIPYDNDAPPLFETQQSDCYVTFWHSSAAAEELTPPGVELPPLDPDYPVPMYVLNVEVDWHVAMYRDGAMIKNLGTHTFTAYQQLPVTEAPAYVGAGT